MIHVKICGITTPEILTHTAAKGARFAGLVCVPTSPRFIPPEQARILARQAPTGLCMVGLFADADDATLDKTLASAPFDFIQLHGSETPARVRSIKSRFHIPLIKAIPIATESDLIGIDDYYSVVDWILFDAKPPKNAVMTGGHGVSFDWTLLKNKTFDKPWMLSGGLTPENVAEALSILKPDAVDVSSGVERERGIKDADKITEFMAAVRT